MNLRHQLFSTLLFSLATAELRSTSPYSVYDHKKTSLTGWRPPSQLRPSLASPRFSSARLTFRHSLLFSVVVSNSKFPKPGLVQHRIVWRLIACSAACIITPRHTNS